MGDWVRIKNVNRRELVVLNRLRAGHSWLTHNHLMDEGVQAAAEPCTLCYREILSVKHLLTNCAALQHRYKIYFTSSNNVKFSLKQLLTESNLIKKVFFLKAINAYESI